jgi:tricarballylate dehydrogenase
MPPFDPEQRYDVLVIGGGNAALCAAISARRAGASVLEAAPHFYRGGNTRHTSNMRCAHDSATEILTGPYTEDEFWEDLKRITQGHTDQELARYMIAESKDMLTWIVDQGVRFQPSLGGTNSFFLGGGRATLFLTSLTGLALFVRWACCSHSHRHRLRTVHHHALWQVRPRLLPLPRSRQIRKRKAEGVAASGGSPDALLV